VIHARGNLEAFVGARFVRPALRPSVPKGDEPPPFGADDLRLLILFSIFCHKFYPFPDPYPPRDFWWEFWWDFFIPIKKVRSCIRIALSCVPGERLELSRDCSQRLLRPQRLPISPSGLHAPTAYCDWGCKYINNCQLSRVNYELSPQHFFILFFLIIRMKHILMCFRPVGRL